MTAWERARGLHFFWGFELRVGNMHPHLLWQNIETKRPGPMMDLFTLYEMTLCYANFAFFHENLMSHPRLWNKVIKAKATVVERWAHVLVTHFGGLRASLELLDHSPKLEAFLLSSRFKWLAFGMEKMENRRSEREMETCRIGNKKKRPPSHIT